MRSEDISVQASSVVLKIPVLAEMSPKFSLLVYYVRDDGETVADSMEFEVEPCFHNEVSDFAIVNRGWNFWSTLRLIAKLLYLF